MNELTAILDEVTKNLEIRVRRDVIHELTGGKPIQPFHPDKCFTLIEIERTFGLKRATMYKEIKEAHIPYLLIGETEKATIKIRYRHILEYIEQKEGHLKACKK